MTRAVAVAAMFVTLSLNPSPLWAMDVGASVGVSGDLSVGVDPALDPATPSSSLGDAASEHNKSTLDGGASSVAEPLDGSVTVDNVEGRTGSAPARALSYGDVIFHIYEPSFSKDELALLDPKKVSIRLVSVSELEGNPTEIAQALDQALVRNRRSLARIQVSLGENDAVSRELEKVGISLSKVIAVLKSAKGQVVLVINR